MEESKLALFSLSHFRYPTFGILILPYIKLKTAIFNFYGQLTPYKKN